MEDPDDLLETVAAINPLLAAFTASSSDIFSHATIRRIAILTSQLLRTAKDVRVRVVAGDILAKLGDPRLIDEQHPFAGPFANEFDNQKRTSIGRYPVTNFHYSKFIEVGGYRHSIFWSPQGLLWLENGLLDGGVVDGMLMRRQILSTSDRSLSYWRSHFGWSPETFEFWSQLTTSSPDEAREILELKFKRSPAEAPAFWYRADLNRANAPVVGVTYFEAEAFASWASANSDTGYALQTEPAWVEQLSDEKAGLWGDDDLRYAANTVESHILRPTAVGVFPRDATKAGVFDVIGNVREWTATPDARTAWSGTGQMHLVGGAWSRTLNVARPELRDSVAPDFWDYNVGFRLMLTRAQDKNGAAK